MSKTHGTRYAYNSGCRCDECRNANNTYMSQYRREKSKSVSWDTHRAMHPWMQWEDVLASNSTKSAWEIASMLERTPAAVTNRRRVLNARKNNNKKENN